MFKHSLSQLHHFLMLLEIDPIIWKYHKKYNVTMIYGFCGCNKFYTTVLTLEEKDNTTLIYGFVSKTKLVLLDWYNLWQCLKQSVKTPYLTIEVLPEHAIAYKHYLPVILVQESLTFNGHACEFLKVDMTATCKLDGMFNQSQL